MSEHAPLSALPLFGSPQGQVKPYLSPGQRAGQEKGLELKEQELKAHEAGRHSELIAELRAFLGNLWETRAILDPRAYVSANDARAYLWKYHPDLWEAGSGKNNWMGSIFRGSWEKTGERVVSTEPSAHGAEVRCWRPKP